MPEEWLTTQEAAELSGYHVIYIRTLLREEIIKGRKWGRSWMVSRESLLEYLTSMQNKGAKRGPKSLY